MSDADLRNNRRVAEELMEGQQLDIIGRAYEKLLLIRIMEALDEAEERGRQQQREIDSALDVCTPGDK